MEFNEIQLSVLRGNKKHVEQLILQGNDMKIQSISKIIPNVTLLHLAVLSLNYSVVEFILNQRIIDINAQDQWGFTALHYAVFTKQKEIVNLLLQHNCEISIPSTASSTPIDFARSLRFDDIADLLIIKANIDNDETFVSFREWLQALGGSEYLSSFVSAGYDIEFISKEGLNDDDLECVGIPKTKLGLRRKLKILYKLNQFYKPKTVDISSAVNENKLINNNLSNQIDEEEDDDEDEEGEDEEGEDEEDEEEEDEEEEDEEEEDEDDEDEDDEESSNSETKDDEDFEYVE